MCRQRTQPTLAHKRTHKRTRHGTARTLSRCLETMPFIRVLTVHFEREEDCPSWAWPLLPFKHTSDSDVVYSWVVVRKYAMWATQAHLYP